MPGEGRCNEVRKQQCRYEWCLVHPSYCEFRRSSMSTCTRGARSSSYDPQPSIDEVQCLHPGSDFRQPDRSQHTNKACRCTSTVHEPLSEVPKEALAPCLPNAQSRQPAHLRCIAKLELTEDSQTRQSHRSLAYRPERPVRVLDSESGRIRDIIFGRRSLSLRSVRIFPVLWQPCYAWVRTFEA